MFHHSILPILGHETVGWVERSETHHSNLSRVLIIWSIPMTVRKTDIVTRVMDSFRSGCRVESAQGILFPELSPERLGRSRAAAAVDALFETIKQTLEKGEDVRIAGFGRFQVRFKWARKGRNPVTGETIMLKPRRIVVFRPSRRLREKMNPERGD